MKCAVLAAMLMALFATGVTTEAQEGDNDGKITKFTENVLIHVVLHELGHGLVREFDLPVLGNEETLADAFATHYAVTKMPDHALDILDARVASLMIEAEEVPRNEWTVKGEHNSDARRAWQIAALAIAHDSQKYAPLAKLVGMSQSDMRKAIDYGSEIHRSWRRILRPLQMPEGQTSNEARMAIDDDSVFAQSIRNGSLPKTIEEIVRSFDWHSQVTIRFSTGDGGAGWSRSKRAVTVNDDYVRRFNLQNATRQKQN